MRKWFFPAILLVSIILAGCSPALEANITPTPEQFLNPIESPERVLAKETDFTVDQITFLDSEHVDWNNACLGAAKPGEMCAQVITPGFRITLDTPAGIYEIHTDETGKVYRIVPPKGVVQIGTAIDWRRTGGIAGICQELTINFDREYELADCANQHTLNTGKLSNEQWKQLDDWLNTYAVFEYKFVPPQSSADMFSDTYSFNGKGDQIPSGGQEVTINDFLSELADQLAKPPANVNLESNSGIEGQALLGPVCPGPQVAGGPEATRCADKPYQATFQVLDERKKVVTTFQTGENGRFEVALSPGTYTLVPETNPNAVLPRASSQTVTVTQGEFTQITISFDTGIR
jgi:hypothetical protein